MSSFLQFFPNTNQQNIGGGSIPVEILGIAGGGGGGTGCNVSGPACCICYLGGGGGGDGGLFHAYNYYVEPGATYPITIGAGGAGGTPGTPLAIEDVGDPGGATIFNNSVCVLRAEGGGGGGAGLSCCYAIGTPTACTLTPRGPYPGGCPEWANSCGQSGGNGGGGGAHTGILQCCYIFGESCRSCPTSGRVTLEQLECQIGKGMGNIKPYCNDRIGNKAVSCSFSLSSPNCCICSNAMSCTVDNVMSEGYAVNCPWGTMAGFPGSNFALVEQYNVSSPTSPCSIMCACGGCGGKNGGNAVVTSYYASSSCYTYPGCVSPAACLSTPGTFDNLTNSRTWYNSSITGSAYQFGSVRGSGGAGGPGSASSPTLCVGGVGNGTAGCAGVMIVKYPSAYGSAPSFPGGTDISPSTPGYYTYCFTASGSITLP